MLSLDRGVAYFTGEPQGRTRWCWPSPARRVTLMRGARVRIEALETFSRVSVIEGTSVSCPAAELDIREGQK